MLLEAKEQAVNEYIRALCKHDISVIEELYAEDATIEDPYGAEAMCGKEAILDFYQQAFDGGVKAELTGPVRVAADSAAFAFNVFVGKVKIEVIDVFQFNSKNQVVSLKAYWSEINVTPVI